MKPSAYTGSHETVTEQVCYPEMHVFRLRKPRNMWNRHNYCHRVRLRSAFILCMFNDCYLFNIQIKLFTLILLHSKSVCLKECVENVDCWVFDAQSVWNYFSTSLLVIIKKKKFCLFVYDYKRFFGFNVSILLNSVC